jgi:hypothetical protein
MRPGRGRASGRAVPALARAVAVRLAVAVVLACSLALGLALAGCGGSPSGAPPGATKKLPPVAGSPRQLKVERAHLALVAHGLRGAEASIRREALAARAAWPGIVHGLPAPVSPASRALIANALDRTQRIATPHFVSYAGELTGAAAAIAGLLLSFEQLSQRGWTMTLAAAQHLAGGARSSLRALPSASGQASSTLISPAALRFIRANASLYIGSVYDGHYNLSVVGERVREAYAQLGGSSAFGAALTPALVSQLAGFYSPSVARLAPKPPT